MFADPITGDPMLRSTVTRRFKQVVIGAVRRRLVMAVKAGHDPVGHRYRPRRDFGVVNSPSELELVPAVG